jgi:hypothetical protein
MRFSVAQVWGVITLLTATFAALRYMQASPESLFVILFLVAPVHAMVVDLVEQMSRGSQRGKRII